MTRIDWLARAREKIANISPQPAVNTVVRNPTTVTTVSRALGFSEKTVRARSNDCIDGTLSAEIAKFGPGNAGVPKFECKDDSEALADPERLDGLLGVFLTAMLTALVHETRNGRISKSAACDLLMLAYGSSKFLESGYAHKALKLGWTELDLFGVFEGPLPLMKGRLDARGLIPFMVWAPWQSLELDALQSDFATISTPSGATLRYRRTRPGQHMATVWWRNPHLIEGCD